MGNGAVGSVLFFFFGRGGKSVALEVEHRRGNNQQKMRRETERGVVGRGGVGKIKTAKIANGGPSSNCLKTRRILQVGNQAGPFSMTPGAGFLPAPEAGTVHRSTLKNGERPPCGSLTVQSVY
jgi:hypothetical protein